MESRQAEVIVEHLLNKGFLIYKGLRLGFMGAL